MRIECKNVRMCECERDCEIETFEDPELGPCINWEKTPAGTKCPMLAWNDMAAPYLEKIQDDAIQYGVIPGRGVMRRKKTIDVVYRRYRPSEKNHPYWVGELSFANEDDAVDYVCNNGGDELEVIRIVEHDGTLIRRYVYSTELGFYISEEDV